MSKAGLFDTDEIAEDADTSVTALIQRVGDRVRACRKAQGLSRRELSERSGVSPRYLAKLEGGEGNISIGLLQRVSIALSCPVESLLVEQNVLAEDVQLMSSLFQKADAVTRARVLNLLDPERMQIQKANRLCLVGLRGAGKSTLGRWVGTHFDAPFIELNSKIEANAGIPIPEIIALYGHEGYRKLEADAISEIVETQERAVLAVAGGIVSEKDTFNQVLSRFHTVWVKAMPGEHMERVREQGDMRPMAGNPQAMIQLREILKTREALYAQADYCLDTSGKSVEDSASELVDLIRSYDVLGQNAL
jgi:XRE family aerobic/anaerobic benzoate catabolism transcriptional regulator